MMVRWPLWNRVATLAKKNTAESRAAALLLRINETESPSNSATRISVHVLETMGPEIASSEACAHSYSLSVFPIPHALPTEGGLPGAKARPQEESVPLADFDEQRSYAQRL
jgi:hypothetical protein